MDPQEATIAALKRELAALRNENMHLREQTLAGAAAAGVHVAVHWLHSLRVMSAHSCCKYSSLNHHFLRVALHPGRFASQPCAKRARSMSPCGHPCM